MKKQVFATLIAVSALVAGFTNVSEVKASEETEKYIIENNSKEILKIKQLGGKVTYTFTYANAVEVEVPKRKIVSLLNNNAVEVIQKEQKINFHTQQIDDGMALVKATESWKTGYTGKGVKVAVIDTGVASHKDLKVAERVTFVEDEDAPEDYVGHGTHVGGIIAAQNNTFGVKGASYGAELYSVQIANLSDLAKGIDWSIKNDVDIINMSLGFPNEDSLVKQLVDKANQKGILVVASAGNEGVASGATESVGFPAKYESVISVGATDNKNKRASFSSTGKVDIAAPGVNVYSTYGTNPEEEEFVGSEYAYMSGTSMSAPYVSGILALYKEAYPTYNNSQIRALMEKNALDLGVTGKDRLFGSGLIQAPTNQLVAMPETTSVPSDFKVFSQNGYEVTLSWSPTIDAKSYELYRDDVLIYSGTGNTFGDAKAMYGTFVYKLIAKGEKGSSDPITLSATIEGNGVPGELIQPKVKTTESEVFISWNESTNAQEYILMRNGKVIYKGQNLSFKETGLKPQSAYLYVLYAQNENGQSLSQYVFAETKVPTLKTKVSGVKAKATTNGVSLTWSEKEWATGYVVKRNGEEVYYGSDLSFVDEKAKTGATYTYAIYAYNDESTSPATVIKVKSVKLLLYKNTYTSINLNKKTFKTGEKLTISSIVKNEGKKVVADAVVTIYVKDAKGKVIYSKKTKTDKNGKVTGAFTFKKAHKKGNYSVVVKTTHKTLKGSTGVVKISKK